MIDRFYHLCVDVFDNASAELGNMNGRQEQFAVGFSGILMHYLMMTAGDQSDLSNLVVRDEEVYRLVHQFMYGITHNPKTRRTNKMAPWYEEAEFYHIYPIG